VLCYVVDCQKLGVSNCLFCGRDFERQVRVITGPSQTKSKGAQDAPQVRA
jgi:hypothetical protein